MNKLTPKEKTFVNEYVENGGNGAKAATVSHNIKNSHSAASLASIYLKKDRIKAEIETIMENRDITPDSVAEKIKEGLDATVVSNYKGGAKPSEIPDYNARHKYVNTAADILKMFPAKQVETKSLNIDLEVDNMSKEGVKKLLSDLLKNASR